MTDNVLVPWMRTRGSICPYIKPRDKYDSFYQNQVHAMKKKKKEKENDQTRVQRRKRDNFKGKAIT